MASSDQETEMEGNEFMTEFIQKYKELECLWQTNHIDYTNRYKRLHCLRELLKIMQKNDPFATLAKVKRKINSIRSNFNKQHKKLMQAKASLGEEGFDLIDKAPPLYYNSLLFLIDRNPKIKRFKSESKTGSETHEFSEDENTAAIYLEEDFSNEDDCSNAEYSKEEPITTLYEFDSSTPTREETKKNFNKKRKFVKPEYESSNYDGLFDSEEADSPTKLRPLFNAFGEHVAEKLRCMPRDVAIYCQKIINDALFYAETGNLNHTSHIITDN
ncbi:uncharacterized protein LOC106137107 [Amyelois transitella]|uniref:uncharacterized protein LOC106137107 n=1 Tax=Amyelois transitella TaxID=680683 RepID=UPI00067B6D31|nr:uncharacterized protein LOC106137107 [Amyelois transitella]